MTVPFLFTIPSGGIARRVRFRDLLPEGLIRIEAADGLKPALLDIPPTSFPWARFGEYLAAAWQNSRPVHPLFRPQGRIPDEVMAILRSPGLVDASALQVLKALRKSGLLPSFRQSANPERR